MRFVAIMDPTHQWPVFDAAAVDTPSHAGAKHGEVALRKKCLWRPPAELLVECKPGRVARSACGSTGSELRQLFAQIASSDRRCKVPIRNLAPEMAF